MEAIHLLKCWAVSLLVVVLGLAGCTPRASEKADTGQAGIADSNPPQTKEAPRPPELTAEMRRSQDNLKKIGAGFEFPKTTSFPAGFADRKRKPILSWRVAILPQLGHQELFQRFNLLEPWDGPTNSKRLAEMPDVFRPVKGAAKAGYTYYQGFVGPDAMFPSLADTGLPVDPTVPKAYSARPFTHVTDGLSYTFLVVEAGEAAPWTRPDELHYDPKQPLPRLGGMFDGHFNALFCDGSVRLIPKSAPERLVRALITPSAEDYADLRLIGLDDPLRGSPVAVTGSTGNIAGQIRFNGTLLRGGTVTIRASDGKTYTTTISPDGRYSFKNVPLGETRIAVETKSVRGKSGTNPENDPYVAIPELYTSLEFSPLNCEVVGGDLNLDFHLHN